MSWSLTKKAPRSEARVAFAAAHQEQACYATSPAHQVVMDEISAFAAAVAEAAPEGAEVTLTSSGHIQDDGHGSAQVGLSFYPAAPATAESASA